MSDSDIEILGVTRAPVPPRPTNALQPVRNSWRHPNRVHESRNYTDAVNRNRETQHVESRRPAKRKKKHKEKYDGSVNYAKKLRLDGPVTHTKKSKTELAEKLYKKKLHEIEKYHVGDKTTYLGELAGAGKKLLGVKFKGVYPSDKIPRLNDLSCYCILNLDSSEEPGSHWIALAKNTEKNHTMVYDSFGRHHMKIIPNLLYSGNGRVVDTQRDAEQDPKETNCGARCLAWLCIYDKWGEDVARLI